MDANPVNQPWFPAPGDLGAQRKFLEDLARKPLLLEKAWQHVAMHPELERSHAPMLQAMRERFTRGSPEEIRIEALDFVLEVQGPAVNFREDILACEGDEKAMLELLERRAEDLDALDQNGQTLIHAFVELAPNLAMAALSVLDPNPRDQLGQTPLQQVLWQLKAAAVEEDDHEVAIQLTLLEALVDNEATDLSVCYEGRSVLHLLCALRDTQCVSRVRADRLEGLAAKILDRARKQLEPQAAKAWLNSVDRETGLSMLQAAARYGFFDLVLSLARLDVVDVRDPLALLIESPRYHPHLGDRQVRNCLINLMNVLSERDATHDLEAEERYSPRFQGWINSPGPGNHTPVMLASELGMPETLGYLLKQGARLTNSNREGRNPLHLAAIGGDLRCVWMLIKAGLSPKREDRHDLTPMDYLLLGGDSDFIQDSIGDERVVSSLEHSIRLSGLDAHEQAQLREQIQDLAKKPTSPLSALLSRLSTDSVDWERLADAEGLQERLSRGRNAELQARISNEVLNATEQLCTWARRRPVAADSDLTALEQSRTCGSSTIGSQPKTLAGWQKADAKVRQWAAASEPLSVEKLCDLNRLVYPKGGALRDCPIRAGRGKRFLYSFEGFLKPEVSECVAWINAQVEECRQGRANPVVVAARAYQRLVSSHPFEDANGRTSRLVMDYVCLSCGLPPPCLGHNVSTAVFALCPRQSCSPTLCVLKVLRGLASSYRLLKQPVPRRMRKTLYEI